MGKSSDVVFCLQEADVDKALLRSPDVYARYMDWLEWTLRFGMTKRVAKGLANDALDDMFNVLPSYAPLSSSDTIYSE